jgi:hypothetical protein
VSAALRPVRATGFTLLPVILAMSLIAAIAFLLNRDNGVNARMIASRSDLDRARYAAEAGLQAVNFVVQGMGCTGTNYPVSSGPVTASNFGGATYSAYADKNKLLGGTPPPPIGLVSTGSYNGASVTLTRSTVYVYQPGTTTTLQPGPTSGYDTYLDSGVPDRNFGAVVNLRLLTGSRQPLLKFDLSAFPTGSRAIPWYDGATLQPGAKLSLYQSQYGPATTAVVNAQLITQSWLAGTGTGGTASPNGATWNTYNGVNAWPSPGVGYAPAPVASTPYLNAVGWVTWDLTNAAAAWMSRVYSNYGVWLVGSGAAIGDTYYASSDYTANTTLRPTLTLNTLLPCGTTGPPSASSTAPAPTTLGAAADTYITANTASGAYVLNYGADTTMYVGEVNTSPNQEQRMLLKFDVSGIPPGSIITSATLRLNMAKIMGGSAANSTKSLDAYALTQSFVEGTSSFVPNTSCPDGASWINRDCGVGWTTLGGTYDATTKYATGRVESSGVSPLPVTFSSGWVTWDLTALAQGWVDGVIVNNGFLVKSNNTDQTYSLQFLTKQNNSGGGAYKPQLVVVYQ